MEVVEGDERGTGRTHEGAAEGERKMRVARGLRLPDLKNDQACNDWKEKPSWRGSGCLFGFRHLRGNSQVAETVELRPMLKCLAKEGEFTFVIQK